MATAAAFVYNRYREPMVRELTLEETKMILSDLFKSGDHEAGKVLEELTGQHPNSSC